MTTQHQIITICVLVFISVPLGTFTIIKTINKLSRPPVNTLVRSGDIELVDFIEPLDNTRDIDLSSLPQYPTNQAIINHTPIRWDLYPVPRYSQLTEISPAGYSQLTENSGNILPRYSNLTDNYINCPLENINIINLNFLLLIFIVFLGLFYFLKLNNNWRMKGSVEGLKMIILWILISILLMNSIIHNSSDGMSILLPFTFFEINFRDSFEWEFDSYRAKHEISYLKIQTLTRDIESLLNSLKEDKDYSMSLSFISSYNEWKDEKEKIYPLFINDAIIVNKESDPILITQFIMKSLNDKDLFLTKGLFNDISINWIDPVILTVIVPIKVKI